MTIARETEAQISLYLFTTTLINLGVGVVTGIAMYLLDMPNPVLWGVVAAVLNFIPYVGAVANTVLLALAAFVTFEDTGHALLVPGTFLVLNLIESNLVTPMDLRESDEAQHGRALHRPGVLVVHLGHSRRDPRSADHGDDQDRLRPHRVAGAGGGVSGTVADGWRGA